MSETIKHDFDLKSLNWISFLKSYFCTNCFTREDESESNTTVTVDTDNINDAFVGGEIVMITSDGQSAISEETKVETNIMPIQSVETEPIETEPIEIEPGEETDEQQEDESVTKLDDKIISIPSDNYF